MNERYVKVVDILKLRGTPAAAHSLGNPGLGGADSYTITSNIRHRQESIPKYRIICYYVLNC